MSKTRAPLEKSKMALLRGWDLSKKLVGKMMKEAEEELWLRPLSRYFSKLSAFTEGSLHTDSK